MTKNLSLHKLRQAYRHHYRWYQKNSDSLSSTPRGQMEASLDALNAALREGDKQEANRWLKELQKNATTLHKKKSPLLYGLEVLTALIFALVVAVVIRQMWFELYQIPTGSMRPTFREKDRLIVTKTSLGLNIPMKTGHLYFNPENVNRGGVIIWKGDGLPYLSLSDRFLGILPYNKRFIKRLMGKPGDTLYFYGGQIWGTDKNGDPIKDLRGNSWNEGLEHIPFSRFEGMPSYKRWGGDQTITFKHFEEPVGRLRVDPFGTIHPEVYTGSKWTSEKELQNSESPEQYGSRFGIDNYGMVRLLAPETARIVADAPRENAFAYLQIFHHPTVGSPVPPPYRTSQNALITELQPKSTLLPLTEKHLDAIRHNLYTSRFVVSRGYGSPYDAGAKNYPRPDAVSMPGIPDGTYEFYYGQAYQVRADGNLKKLPQEHPLQPGTLEELITLFNMGIEFNARFDVTDNPEAPLATRFAYWRNGELFVGGGAIGSITYDQNLQDFVVSETKKSENAPNNTYQPFIDKGPPVLADGSLDKERIEKFGLKIPEGHYLVLGDNHSRSADSRVFGFLPEANIEGTPSLILWPAQERWGHPSQPSYKWFTWPRLLVWSVALLLLFGWRWWIRKEAHRPFHPIIL